MTYQADTRPAFCRSMMCSRSSFLDTCGFRSSSPLEPKRLIVVRRSAGHDCDAWKSLNGSNRLRVLAILNIKLDDEGLLLERAKIKAINRRSLSGFRLPCQG